MGQWLGQMMYNCVLLNGDSYSANTHWPTYGEYVSRSLNLPIYNIAYPGSNNDRILRSTIEKVLELKNQNFTPLVIIGWSFVRRLEVWYYGHNARVTAKTPDRTSKSLHAEPRFVSLETLIAENEASMEQKCLIQQDLCVHKQLTDFYTKIYLCAQFLQLHGLPWFMFSAAKNIDMPVKSFPYIESLSHVQWCQHQPNIHNLHEFCVINWAKDHDPHCNPVTGHLSSTGHEKFATVILDCLRSINLV